MTSQADLGNLECPRCHATRTPILRRNTTTDALGAYCPVDRGWITWVPQNDMWLALERMQNYHTNSQEGQWIITITQMGQFCYDQAERQGFHSLPRSTLERAMLVVTELAELSEAARNSKLHAPSDHIPEFTNAEEEWADVLVRVFDHSPDDGVTPERLGRAFVAKLAYNRTRGHRHGGKTI